MWIVGAAIVVSVSVSEWIQRVPERTKRARRPGSQESVNPSVALRVSAGNSYVAMFFPELTLRATI